MTCALISGRRAGLAGFIRAAIHKARKIIAGFADRDETLSRFGARNTNGFVLTVGRLRGVVAHAKKCLDVDTFRLARAFEQGLSDSRIGWTVRSMVRRVTRLEARLRRTLFAAARPQLERARMITRRSRRWKVEHASPPPTRHAMTSRARRTQERDRAGTRLWRRRSIQFDHRGSACAVVTKLARANHRFGRARPLVAVADEIRGLTCGGTAIACIANGKTSFEVSLRARSRKANGTAATSVALWRTAASGGLDTRGRLCGALRPGESRNGDERDGEQCNRISRCAHARIVDQVSSISQEPRTLA
jgi:hypothetical protein